MKRHNFKPRKTGVGESPVSLFAALNNKAVELNERTEMHDSMQAFVSGNFDEMVCRQVETSLQSIVTEVCDTILSAGDTPDNYSESQLKAMAYSVMGSQDPGSFAAKSLASLQSLGVKESALSQPWTTGDTTLSIDALGDELVSQQAFDEPSLRKMAPVSNYYNLRAPRQGHMEELFYPTLTVDPDTPLVVYEVRYPVIPKPQNYTLDGAQVDDSVIPLLRATWDPTLLENAGTKVVPYFLAGTNDDKFIGTDMAAEAISVGDIAVPTKPLAFGSGNIIGLAQHPDVMNNETMQYEDMLDRRVKLASICLQAAYDNAGTMVYDTYRLPTAYLAGSTFLPSRNGKSTTMEINFTTKALAIGPATESVASAVPLLVSASALAYNIVLKLSVYGDVDIADGNYNITAGALSVAYVTNASGVVVDHTVAGAVKTQVDAVMAGLSIVGFEFDAVFSNANRRFEGMMVDTITKGEEIMLPIGYPFTAKLPIAPNKDLSVIANHLVFAATTKTSINAIDALYNYADQLKGYMLSKAQGTLAEVEGLGRYLMEPTFLERSVDVLAELNSTSTTERSGDIHALLSDRIRELAYSLYDESHYQSALDYVSETPNAKPILGIGTKAKIGEFLSIDGEPKLAGVAFDYKIGFTQNTRVNNTIWITFLRPEPSLNDFTSFAVHLWMPQLVSTVTRTVGNSTVQQAQVIPRSLHLHKAPVLGKITITNLEEALQERVSYTTV